MKALHNGMIAGVLALSIVGTACTKPVSPESSSQRDSAALGRFKAAGKQAAITVYPTRVVGVAMPKVGEVIAMMLENGGMTNLELSDQTFKPVEGADWNATATAFAEFVKAKPPATDYALFADILGTPGKGASEVRTVVVNKTGEIIWQDRQAKGDHDFDAIKPKEPIQCCDLIAKRIQPLLGLDRAALTKSGTGKITKRWAKESGIPDDAERAQMANRAKTLRAQSAKSSITVYPFRVRDTFNRDHASTVAGKVDKKVFAKTTVAAQGPQPEIQPSINEQKVLWSMAGQVSEYVKAHPPETDYVLYADYFSDAETVRAIHFVICDRKGDLVVVDFQNRNNPELKAANPRSVEDCDKFIVDRLAKCCK